MARIVYRTLLAEAIIAERNGRRYCFSGKDKDVIREMCDEINETYPDYYYKFHYLSEIEQIDLPVGAGAILLKYIHQFESESCRAALIPSIITDRIYYKVKYRDLDKTMMDLYLHFLASDFAFALPGSPYASSHIYMAYDNAFWRLKSKKIMPQIVERLKNRLEVMRLSITAKMIARKWAPPELGEIMANHLSNKNVTKADLGIPEASLRYFEYIVEQSCFTAIYCLQFYPSKKNLEIVLNYTKDYPPELVECALKHAKIIEDKLQSLQNQSDIKTQIYMFSRTFGCGCFYAITL